MRQPFAHRLAGRAARCVASALQAAIALWLVACGAAEAPAPSIGDELVVTALHGLDGDSLRGRVAGVRHEFRLWGIDAPERDQPHADASRAALKAAVDGEDGTATVVAVDDYDRLVVRLQVDGRSVNRAQLTAGHAWWYRRYAGDEAAFQAAETAAREAGRGLWVAAEPEAPWAYRARTREKR